MFFFSCLEIQIHGGGVNEAFQVNRYSNSTVDIHLEMVSALLKTCNIIGFLSKH